MYALRVMGPRLDISGSNTAQGTATQLPGTPGWRVVNPGTTVAYVTILPAHEDADGDAPFALLKATPIPGGQWMDFINPQPNQFGYANVKMASGTATVAFQPCAFK